MNTKEKIEKEALKLFAQKGYSASSVRNICSAVGIKESVIYYYFQNKQAVLDTLRDNFEMAARMKIDSMRADIETIASADRDFFFGRVNSFVQGYLLDPFIKSFTRILVIEQGNDVVSRKLYRTWLYEQPLQYFKDLFKKLISLGYMKTYNTDFYAMSCYTSVFFCYQEHLLFEDGDSGEKMRYDMKVKQYLSKFLDQYEAK